MGYGSYRASDWTKLKVSRGIREDSTAQELFQQKEVQDAFNPRYNKIRESRDSTDSPESTPIIIGFDVTGSMGYLAEEIAKNAMHKTVTQIYEKKPVSNPHILCAAIGDVTDKAPLQVTQFEADIRIQKQLLDLWLEGGGGDAPESFNLLWYFAAFHTRTDAYEKRGKKGILFTIGDASTHPGISGTAIAKIFGDPVKDWTNEELLARVSEQYEVYHIIVNSCSNVVFAGWNRLLPGRVATLNRREVKYLAEVILSILQVVSGKSQKAVLAQWTDGAEAVAHALETIQVPPKPLGEKKNSFFRGIFGS